MRILFDHQAFVLQTYGGISRYFCELITGINETSEHNAHLSLLWSNNTHLHEYGLNVMPYYFPKRHRLLRATNRYYNLMDIRLNKFDIYHPTYFSPFFMKCINHTPYVVTYYDMIHEKFANKFRTLGEDKNTVAWKKAISIRASHFIAISENTKKDMVHYLNIEPERIRVIHLASSMKVVPERTPKSGGRPYLLYVGNRDVYKNFLLFLTAVAPVLKSYNLRLICAGGGTFNETEREALKRCKIETDVEQCSITDQVLIQLYSQAVAFVFPSLYEGFGIPILEAMSCGCPCILSDRSSMPEVAGEAARYFNPNSADSMRSTIINLLDDEQLRIELMDRGLKRATSFSWKRTVQETLSLYTNVLAETS